MKILLAARNDLIDRFSEAFTQAGAELAWVADPELLGVVGGRRGAFTYKLGGEPADAELVVLAGDVAVDPLLTDDAAFRQRLDRQPFHEPLVLVLDRGAQSPSSLTSLALRRAAQAVRRRRGAVVFARDFRTADRGNERLYREAREAGVAVVRYQTLEISSEDGVYSLSSLDGATETRVQSGWVIDASARPAPEVDAFARKLRLKEPSGYGTEDRYWLYPEFTSRKGVYFIDASLLTGVSSLKDVAERIVRSGEEKKAAFAHVDPVKCALCYTCYRACPHAALAPDPASSAMLVDERACDACGICVALCPANALELRERPATQSGAERGALKILACENSAYHAAMAALGDRPKEYGVGIESVPCCGVVNGGRISRELEDFDTVLVAACVEDACHHFDGNIKGCLHTKRLIENMARLGLKERVRFCNASASMTGPIKQEIDSLIGVSAEV